MKRLSMIDMRIDSAFGEEKKVLQELKDKLSTYHFLEQDCAEFLSALAEVCINAIEHGNQLVQSKKVWVQVYLIGNRMRGLVMDEGTGFVLQPSVRDERGWGLTIVREFVDGWTMYQHTDEHRLFCFQIEKRLREDFSDGRGVSDRCGAS